MSGFQFMSPHSQVLHSYKVIMKMMSLRNFMIATLLLWNSIMCLSIKNEGSNGKFSSLLETVVNDAVLPTFRLSGPNGNLAISYSETTLQLSNVYNSGNWENCTYHDDGTLRIAGKCIYALGFTQNSLVNMINCNSASVNAKVWDLSPTSRQITHRASGLVLSSICGNVGSRLTLEENVFASYQTWRVDYKPPITTANIIGMWNYCLHTSNNEVWLARCGTSGAAERWLIYPDGTIRPQQRSGGCLSFRNQSDRTVLVTTCGLSATNERWLLKNNGHLLNENSNLVLDVAGGNPDLRKIIAYPPTANPGPNQQWHIVAV